MRKAIRRIAVPKSEGFTESPRIKFEGCPETGVPDVIDFVKKANNYLKSDKVDEDTKVDFVLGALKPNFEDLYTSLKEKIRKHRKKYAHRRNPKVFRLSKLITGLQEHRTSAKAIIAKYSKAIGGKRKMFMMDSHGSEDKDDEEDNPGSKTKKLRSDNGSARQFQYYGTKRDKSRKNFDRQRERNRARKEKRKSNH
jgi:hypothetical protein